MSKEDKNTDIAMNLMKNLDKDSFIGMMDMAGKMMGDKDTKDLLKGLGNGNLMDNINKL
jgi:hypothetical protein